MSFWHNKPLNVQKFNSCNSYNLRSSYILTPDVLLNNVDKEIIDNKLQLDYHVMTSPDEEIILQLLDFINKNYNETDNTMSLEYSKELFHYYITSNTLCILFYPKNHKPTHVNTDNMIGFVCGKRQIMYIKDSIEQDNFKQYDIVDGNFLCLVKSLRKLHLSSYMINVMTKECLNYSDKKISCSAYTVSQKLNTKSFSKKSFYHRPLNITNLLASELISDNNSIMKKIWNTFSYEMSFLNNSKFIFLEIDKLDTDELNQLVDKLHDKLLTYNKLVYDIFDYKSKNDIKKILTNTAFYKFLIINKTTGEIEDFICLYNLVTKNNITKNSSRNGYFYIFMTLKDDNYKCNIIEYISEYCYKNNLFDMITTMDIMEPQNFNKYKKLKLLSGSTDLYYYLYNITLSPIEPYKNGLITI